MTQSNVITILANICIILFAAAVLPAAALNMPPKNPYLANSSSAMAHNDSAQQDAVAHAGPSGPSRILGPDEIQYNHLGPAHFGSVVSGQYADGHRVLWGNGLDRIVKIDHDSYKVLDEYLLPGVEVSGPELAEQSITAFNNNNHGFGAIVRTFKHMNKMRSLSGIYTLLDRNHNYFVGSKSGLITAYGDADPADSRSPIVKKSEFQIPPQATGSVVGINITYDGWLIVVTEHGYVVAIKRDFSDHRLTRLKHSDDAENKATGGGGYGWVRNTYAVDPQGGIYIASQQHLHKVVWTGDELSTAEKDGAWSAAYLNGWGHGSGATPSLMGFGEEDKFVVITDGQPQMNVVLFWRDAIPEQWQQLPGTPDRRIAGQLPVTMGDDSLREIQSEQSVVVAGYGALVVNNGPRNIPWYLPRQATPLLISLLGSNPAYQPYGAQKFSWNPELREFQNTWVNRDVSSPSSVPIVSVGSNKLYLIGARNNQWTLEALDWTSGESVFHYVIGDQRYNPLFTLTSLDEAGRIHYGTPWGRVRLVPRAKLKR